MYSTNGASQSYPTQKYIHSHFQNISPHSLFIHSCYIYATWFNPQRAMICVDKTPGLSVPLPAVHICWVKPLARPL